MNPRPASITAVTGFTLETACTQPVSSDSGTYTGARNSATNTGIWISGPACSVRRNIAIPIAHSAAVKFMPSPRTNRPNSSMPLPSTRIPAISPATVTTVPTISQRTSAPARVARDDPAAARRAEHQPAREPRLEVARHGKAREHAAEGGGLQEHEGELERRVAGPVVEVRDIADPRQPAGERDEEEQREDDRRHDDRRVDERVVDRAPGDRAGDVEKAPHVRASLDLIAGRASTRQASASANANPNASSSAWAFQPWITRLRSPSIR